MEHSMGFQDARIDDYVERFHRDGFVHVKDAIPVEIIEKLKAAADRLRADPDLRVRSDPNLADSKYVMHLQDDDDKWVPYLYRNTIQLDPIFPQMLTYGAIWEFAKRLLGDDCKFCGQNVIVNPQSVAIDRWHVDGEVHFPVPEGVERHSKEIPPPLLWITVQVALTDVETMADGPTQYVPGSHLSGKAPNDPENPTFEGSGPVSVLAKAGDIYIQNPQCWHRGAPRTSEGSRYIFQTQYAVSWLWERFHLAPAVPVDDHTLSTWSDDMLGVLGKARPSL